FGRAVKRGKARLEQQARLVSQPAAHVQPCGKGGAHGLKRRFKLVRRGDGDAALQPGKQTGGRAGGRGGGPPGILKQGKGLKRIERQHRGRIARRRVRRKVGRAARLALLDQFAASKGKQGDF